MHVCVVLCACMCVCVYIGLCMYMCRCVDACMCVVLCVCGSVCVWYCVRTTIKNTGRSVTFLKYFSSHVYWRMLSIKVKDIVFYVTYFFLNNIYKAAV